VDPRRDEGSHRTREETQHTARDCSSFHLEFDPPGDPNSMGGRVNYGVGDVRSPPVPQAGVVLICHRIPSMLLRDFGRSCPVRRCGGFLKGHCKVTNLALDPAMARQDCQIERENNEEAS
jgi:hypothetical protein